MKKINIENTSEKATRIKVDRAAFGGKKAAKSRSAESFAEYNCSVKKETLCWTCNHSTCAPSEVFNNIKLKLTNGALSPCQSCPWAAYHKAVPGWTATPTRLKVCPDHVVDSYVVQQCPYYDPNYEGKALALTKHELAELLLLKPSDILCRVKLCTQLAAMYLKLMDQIKEQYKKTGKGMSPYKIATKRKLVKHVIVQYYMNAKANFDAVLEDGDPNNIHDKRDAKTYMWEAKQCIILLDIFTKRKKGLPVWTPKDPPAPRKKRGRPKKNLPENSSENSPEDQSPES